MTEPRDQSRHDDAMATLIELRALTREVTEAGQESFFSEDNKLVRLASRMIIVQFSEAASRLLPAFRDKFLDIPWNDIQATRNRMAHEYIGVNDRFTWVAISGEIPHILDRILKNADE